MQEIVVTMAEVGELDFLAAGTGVKYAFFRFIEMALSYMGHRGLKDKLTHNSFER